MCNMVFEKCIEDYHQRDDVNAPIENPYPPEKQEHLLYLKCWIDAVQWHLEDLVRNPAIPPAEGMAIKRRIDQSNQQRTDVVEMMDDYFFEKYKHVKPLPGAGMNTESPAWAIDRLSILALKIYHMKLEAARSTSPEEHRLRCAKKLAILLQQQKNLSQSIDELLREIEAGSKRMNVYRQMKMYNDPALNPVLYQSQSPG
jgi:hypothetical protein